MSNKILLFHKYNFLFSVMLLTSIVYTSCECTKGYFFDNRKIKSDLRNFDSAYYFSSTLHWKYYNSERSVLELEGTNFSVYPHPNQDFNQIKIDSCVLYWDTIQDSLRCIDLEEQGNTKKELGNVNFHSVRFFTDHKNENKLGKNRDLNLIIFIPKDSFGYKTYISRHYVLKKYKTCRIGVH